MNEKKMEKITEIPIKIPCEFSKKNFVSLFYGDVSVLLPKIPDSSINLIITSPPYNIGKPYEDKLSIESYLEKQEMIIKQLYRILSDNGSICWQVGNHIAKAEVFPLDMLFYPIFKNLKFILRNRIIWHFGHGLHANKRFSGRYETLLWFTKSNRYKFHLDPIRIPSKYPGKRHYKGPNRGKLSGNPKGKNPTDIWRIVKQDWENEIWEIPNVKARHPEKTIEPCQFPIELVERCILALSDEYDLVFDPFAGSGSTLLAAAIHRRKSIGAEKEKMYYLVAIDRLKKLRNGNLPIRPIERPIYVPSPNSKIAKLPHEWFSDSSFS